MPDRTRPTRHATHGVPRYRLRRSVYDRLMAGRNADTVRAQADLTGIPVRSLERMRSGGSIQLGRAKQLAELLDVEVDHLIERVPA